ncbi:MAG: hypothetical protein JST06_08710 [Bacteroidetes bacterium]|nr:hypothetical protein [Bacteroidota bacterium]MBS1629752.1 hypothetical protein [Bacteroidota bacterium]
MSILIRYVTLISILSFVLTANSKAAVLKAPQPLLFYEWNCIQFGAQPTEYLPNSWPLNDDRPRKHKNPDDLYNSNIEGRVALVSSIFSAAALLAFSLTSFPFFLVPVVAFSVFALVFGTVGFRRRQRGVAVAGFSLGFIFLVWGFALIAAL